MRLLMNNYVSGTDYGEVYRLFADGKTNELILSKPDHNAMNVFSKWLDKKLENEFNDFMVFRTKDGKFVGFAYSYDFQPLNGHCLITVAIKQNYQKTGMGAVISIEFLKYLFTHYNIRKVFMHIYSNNEMSIRCVERFGCKLEGVLEEYKYSNGQFVDLKIYALTKEQFLSSHLVSIRT